MIPLRINFTEQYPKPTIIEHCVRLGLPYLDAQAANEEVVRLTVENLRLQAALDAREIRT